MADDTAPLSAEELRAEEAQAQRDFESGITEQSEAPAKPAAAKPEATAKPAEATAKPAAAPAKTAAATPAHDYIRVTRKDWDEVRAAAAKTASYDQQLSRVFGTVGNMQKVLNDLQTATPRGGKIEIPKDAFAGMERDFPELAEHTRAALEATLRGFTGSGPANANIDPDKMTQLVREHVEQVRINAEAEAIEEDFPDWRKIVGHVDVSKQAPDPRNPFRAWLATKGAAYEARINGTMSAAVLSRAIARFQSETKATAPPAPSLRAQLQAARIRGAVQPRGDGGQAPASRSEDDDFLAGYASR